MLSAATVRHAVLEPGMDARALNIEQSRIVFDPSPESDSLVEVLADLGAYQQAKPHLIALTRSNHAEGKLECGITLWADTLATDLRDLELNGGAGALSGKSLARALREPLRAFAGSGGAAERARAAAAIWRVTKGHPRAQLLTPSVRHELGAAKFRLLEEMLP